MTKEKQAEFMELTNPLIKWLNDNTDPHAKIIIEFGSAELVSGEYHFPTDEFILD